MGIMNLRHWRKAYMIEFLKNDNEVEDVFTFSVPPESENFEFPQRITETPTFGGVVFDDYGNDTVKIRLTGSTINEERKLIYRGNKKLPDYLTGEKEIFKLQELFEKWGNLNNPYFASKKIYLYDLSKMNILQIGAGSPTRNYWRIVNKGLKIKRAKDKPFTYNYELELIGVNDKFHEKTPLFGSEGIGGFLEGCQNVVETIETIAEITEEVADAIDTMTQQVVEVKKFVEKLKNGNARNNTEAVMRKLPGGNSLWNSTKAVMSTASKIQYLTGTSSFRKGRCKNYSRYDSFLVSFNSGAGSYVSPARTDYGKCAKKPADIPTRQGYIFEYWCIDSLVTQEFDFSTPITGDITLYAKWHEGDGG
jgi:uncharacterized repeat protein (TIGR02543 family)